jgi:hypothetical protein
MRIDLAASNQLTARKEFPDADIHGQGFYASVSECSSQVVHLHETELEAQRAVEWIDAMTCGGRFCRPTSWAGEAMHYLVDLTA